MGLVSKVVVGKVVGRVVNLFKICLNNKRSLVVSPPYHREWLLLEARLFHFVNNRRVHGSVGRMERTPAVRV